MDTEPTTPTPLTDPQGYLALRKFSCKLPQCPRTGLPVSFADIGDPDGTPVLFVPPSGCTRWFAAPQDPLANGYNIRLICVDRPGTGAVPMVPLSERIDTSCKMIASVLEFLDVKPAHMLATSAGVYCALRLLSSYPEVFMTGLSPPPAVYFISPWSPPLPATDPLAYRQLLDWIPDSLITTQDVTLPYIIPAVKGLEGAYEDTSKAVGAAVSAVKSWWGGWGAQSASSSTTSAPAAPAAPSIREERKAMPEPEADAANAADANAADANAADANAAEANAEHDSTETSPPPRKRLWAPSAKYLTMDYLYAEDFRGIGQEHLLCLNRGGAGTGPEWFTNELDAVAAAVHASGSSKLHIDVWWGGQDGMVPHNGQEWLNRAFAAHPKEIAFATHFVEDGDHSDLIMRAQGIGEVYMAIMIQGHSTRPLGERFADQAEEELAGA